MTNQARLLDSSVVIRHFRRGGEVSDKLLHLGGLYVPSIVLGELMAGAYRSARPDHHLAQISNFLPAVILIPVCDDTAKHYGLISAQLAAKGTPIPQNDIWIAACAMQWGLTLATGDAHFELIEGLSVEKW